VTGVVTLWLRGIPKDPADDFDVYICAEPENFGPLGIPEDPEDDFDYPDSAVVTLRDFLRAMLSRLIST